MPYGREGEGLHLPPVPEALSRACPTSKPDPEAAFPKSTVKVEGDGREERARCSIVTLSVILAYEISIAHRPVVSRTIDRD